MPKELEASEGDIRNLHSSYTKLQTLHAHFSSIYSVWPIGCEISMIGAAVVNLFLAVIFLSFRFLINGVLFSCLITGFFTRFAEAHAQSSKVIESWKGVQTRGSRLWFHKYLRSCQPISMRVGGLFQADAELVLTIISIIISNATSLILAYRAE